MEDLYSSNLVGTNAYPMELAEMMSALCLANRSFRHHDHHYISIWDDSSTNKMHTDSRFTGRTHTENKTNKTRKLKGENEPRSYQLMSITKNLGT